MDAWAKVRSASRASRKYTIPILFVVSALLSVSLRGCRAPSNKVTPSRLNQPVTVSEWHLLGPFKMSVPDHLRTDAEYASSHPELAAQWEVVVEHDYLSDIGYSEVNLDMKTVEAVSRRSEIHEILHQNGSQLFIHRIFPNLNYAVVYAVAEIVSSEEGDVGIGAGSDDGLRLWLNGRLLVRTPGAIRREARSCDRLVIGHLHKGSNILVAKVDQKDGNWALGVDLMSVEAAREAVVQEREGKMIVRKLLPAGQPLLLVLRMLGAQEQGSLEIRDRSEHVVWSRQGVFPPEYRVDLPSLKNEEYYTCEFQAAGRKASDGFFLGDPDRLCDRLRRRRRQLHDGEPLALAFDALLERYYQLNRPGRTQPGEVNWHRKVTVVLTEGLAALSSQDALEWQKAEGWHFRRFVSTIDGEPQDYLLYIPARHAEPMPIVVTMPADVGTSRPFLEGALLWDALRFDRLGRLATKSGLAMALIYGRGNASDAPIGEADAFEVLRDIERDFPLDARRLYLFGSCSGALRALRLGAHFPGVFAAVAAYRPTIWGSRDATQPAVRWWSTLNSPAALAPSLGNVPVLLLHGDSDPEFPLEKGRAAWKLMLDRGCHAQFQVVPGGQHTAGADPESLAFPFLARQRRPDSVASLRLIAPRLKYADAGALRFDQAADERSAMEGEARLDSGRIVIRTRNVTALSIRPGQFGIPAAGRLPVDWNSQRNVATMSSGSAEVRLGQPPKERTKSAFLEGPIADVFTDGFEIVIGHGGGAVAAESARAVAEALRSTWQSVFFNSCRLRQEGQVSDSELRTYHIVFVGKPAQDGRFAAIRARLPVSLGKGRLSIAGIDYAGANLTFALLQPNPLNASRYLVLVDSTADSWRLPETDLAHRGYFDFAVWNQMGHMIGAGLFDREWKNAAPFAAPHGFSEWLYRASKHWFSKDAGAADN